MGAEENKELPLNTPECFPSSRDAQHSDELLIYSCRACLESCAAHTWVSPAKGQLVLLHQEHC